MEQVLVQLKDGGEFIFDTLGCTIGDLVVVNMDDDVDVGIVFRMCVSGVAIGRILTVVDLATAKRLWEDVDEKG